MCRVDKEDELPKLYKSKYLQSNCIDSYESIEKDLKKGKNVLLCSSPCQVAAIKSYLNKSYENLITLDFICHGVPSQSFFNKCKSYVEEKNDIKIVGYQFRTKIKNGSTPHYYTLIYEKDGKRKIKSDLYIKTPFYLAFQKYITLRDSCCLLSTSRCV